jgi:hypothetical protein
MGRWLITVLVVVESIGSGRAAAMPCCTLPPRPLREQLAEAQVVMCGTTANPRVLKSETNDKVEVTDFHIKRVVKMHPIVGGAQVIELPRYIATDPKKDMFLIFCDVWQGKLDPYQGIPVTSAAVIDYLQEVAPLNPADRTGILAHAYRYLDHADPVIAEDAWVEFSRDADRGPGADYRPLAECLSADRIARWLRDPKTPDWKLGLYAQLLGHCGGVEHARLLRHMLDDKDAQPSVPRIEGLLVGYTLLQPQQGCAAIDALAADSSRPFTDRYAALRIIRFFWEKRPDVVSQKKLLKGIARLLEQSDIADLAIEDLRKWGQWQMIDQVMALKDKPSHNTIPIMRRALLRFALCCPKNAAAAEYVELILREDPTKVEEVEELLRLENAGR